MEDKFLQPLTWLGNLFIFSLVLYMAKSGAGIDLNPNCHADEAILGQCKANRNEHLINNMKIINKF